VVENPLLAAFTVLPILPRFPVKKGAWARVVSPFGGMDNGRDWKLPVSF
jgi:hypothetical protein